MNRLTGMTAQKILLLTSSFLLTAAIAFADYHAGDMISLQVLYLIPIALVTWNISRASGIIFSVAAGIIYFSEYLLYYYSKLDFTNIFLIGWNSAMTLVFLLITAVLLASVKSSYEREHTHARTDHLTGIPNRLYFDERGQLEYERTRRKSTPLCVVYIDCDNFKWVNDNLGHESGDEVLKLTAQHINSNIRAIDTCGRLGGDEFAMIISDIPKAEIEQLVTRLKNELLDIMSRHKFPVTYSIGIAYFSKVSGSFSTMIHTADSLMYEVKKSGKNMIKISEFSE